MANQRTLLKEQAYQQLKQMLLDGTYPPGVFLSERRLAEELGMSKTPVGAALQRLDAEGYVTISPQQGIVVREMSLREIKDHYEIRMALEPFIVRHLAGTLNHAQIAEMEKNLTDQAICLEANDIPGHVAHDRDFHLLLATFLGNQEILRVMEHQRDKTYRVTIQISLRHPLRIRDSYAEHLAIAEALLAGNGAAAAEQMEKHLNIGRQFILFG